MTAIFIFIVLCQYGQGFTNFILMGVCHTLIIEII